MPLRWFKCPDGELAEVEECLQKCRLGRRCLTLPTLKAVSRVRKWSGRPSTTQMLNGTMMEFLKLTRDYHLVPKEQAFALLGTQHHKHLEQAGKELGLPTEIVLDSETGQNVVDLLEPCEGKFGYSLTDYKTWGSFRVVRAIGIVDHKIPDPSGERYKRGPKTGQLKQVSEFSIDASTVDMWDVELQLNHYRVQLEQAGVVIQEMQIQITVRDGGLRCARDRGIMEKIYLLPVRKLDDRDVWKYFGNKEAALHLALSSYEKDKGYLPLPCSERESWDSRRCNGFCPVAKYCPQGKMVLAGGML